MPLARYFNKPLQEITLEDIHHFFAQIPAPEESNYLECKAYHGEVKGIEKKQEAILEAICAFLNSDGGLVIWGGPADQEQKRPDGSKHRIFSGALLPVPQLIHRDTFINKLTDSIIPAPRGIQFHTIEVEAGRYIYLLEVEKSIAPPHQYRNIYYFRVDGATRPAPHHYIEALMKQVKVADLNGFIFTDYQSRPSSNHGNISFCLSINNFSKYLPAFNVKYTLGLTYGNFFYKEDGSVAIHPKGRADRDVFASTALHYNMPYTRDFYVVLPELHFGEMDPVEISLFTYADNCPLKVSRYIYKVYVAPSSPTPLLRLVREEENQFSFAHSDGLNLSEKERAKLAADYILKKMNMEYFQHPVAKQLEGM